MPLLLPHANMEKPVEQPVRRETKIYEMFLVGQVASQRVEQVLDILAGLTASQPKRRIEQHVIYRPDRSPPEKEVIKGGSQTITQPKSQAATASGSKDLSLARLVRDLEEPDFGNATKSDSSWRHVHWELPTASQKEAILRAVTESAVYTEQPEQYMILLKYKPITQLIFDGHQYIRGNIVLFLHQVKRLPDSEPVASNGALPAFKSLVPVDPANTALLQATIELHDSTSTELVNSALSELKAIQEQMKGVVDLVAPERLSFDTRIK